MPINPGPEIWTPKHTLTIKIAVQGLGLPLIWAPGYLINFTGLPFLKSTLPEVAQVGLWLRDAIAYPLDLFGQAT